MSDLLVYGPHILVGAAALFFFWRTLLTVKGSAPHRRNGRRYLLLLVPLLATTVLFALQALAVEGPVRVVQLVYLVLVVAAAGWTAWRAIRDRATPERFTGPVFRALAVGLTGMGVLLMVMGIVTTALRTPSRRSAWTLESASRRTYDTTSWTMSTGLRSTPPMWTDSSPSRNFGDRTALP